jgi:hypothetical protein
MQRITETLAGLKVGDPIVFQNLTMFPIAADDAGEPSYLTLDEALADGLARISEISEHGSVPELRFENTSEKPVFLMDGEELIGAKQNRVLNLSILAPAEAMIVIPVSCVEAGRWAYRSADFKAAPRAQHSRARASKAASVSMSLRASESRRSNQSAVWDEIEEKMERSGTHSETRAMSDIFEKFHGELDQFIGGLSPADGQIGALFAIGGEIAGIDFFDAQATFSKVFSKLVRSYALDALDSVSETPAAATVKDAVAFLKSVKAAKTEAFSAVGLGEDARLDGEGTIGGALVVDEKVVHLWAFPQVRENERSPRFRPSNLTRASQRRGRQ